MLELEWRSDCVGYSATHERPIRTHLLRVGEISG
jgi:hypothetical protein